MLVALLAAALIALVAWGSLSSIAPPRAVSATAPADEFSAERARVHQTDLSQKPHPAGSAEAGRIRDMITTQLRDRGIASRVEPLVGSLGTDDSPTVAYTENVVGVIPGSDPTGTVTLVAHYDAAPASLGAGDDGAGVATLLETARALTSGPPLRNTVVLLFTDAEEMGMLGAEAYVSQDPASRDGGVVLNIESRGTSGPALMFETSAGNRELIELYARHAPVPVATSLSVELYRLLPNDTDLSPMLATGRYTGLNTSYLDGSAVYHSPEDSIERQSIESLQHHGTNALALTHALGEADLAGLSSPGPSDATYFPVFGKLVHYPEGAVWPLAIAAALAVLGAGVITVRHRVVSAPRLLAGLPLALIPLGIALTLGGATWSVLTAVDPGYAQLEDTWQPGWFRASLVAALAAVTLGMFAVVRRWVPAEAVFFGGLAWGAVIGLVAASTVPGASYLAAIPALGGAVALIVRSLSRRGWIAFTVAGVLATALLVPTAALLLPVSGLPGSGPALACVALLMLMLLPLLDLWFPQSGVAHSRPVLRHLLPPVAVAVIAAITFGVGLGVDRLGPSSPVPVALAHVEDADTGEALWVSEGSDPSGWSAALVGDSQDISDRFPVFDGAARVGKAAPTGAPAPLVRVTGERLVEGDREVDLSFASRIDARTLYIAPAAGTIRSISVAGREVATDGVPSLRIDALSRGTAEVTIRIDGTAPLTLRLIEGADGIAALPGFTPRPDGVVPAAGPNAETRYVARSVTL